MSTESLNINSTATLWQQKQHVARRDFWAKTISAYALLFFNMVLLGGALYCIIQYCPLPTEALLVSPFIGGVLFALVYLKIPTCGINSGNYQDLLNPVRMLGLVSACLFFAPLLYVIKCIDLTPYHDSIKANAISDALSTQPLEKITSYGRHAKHLVKYGFIPEDEEKNFSTLCEEYETARKVQEFWKQAERPSNQNALAAQNNIHTLKNQWSSLQNKIRPTLPHPEEPIYQPNHSLSTGKRRVYRYLLNWIYDLQPSHTSSSSTSSQTGAPPAKNETVGASTL